MDILTHLISGTAVSTVIMPFAHAKGVKKWGIIGAGAIGGAFPDIDAISLWSKFDPVFGRFFNFSDSGRDIYFSKYWYSHHGFFHSLAGILLSAILLTLIFHFISFLKKKKGPDKVKLIAAYFVVSAFFMGGTFHLIEDMLTPAGPWGGVRLLWPSKAYFGGLGVIWWWNNYDIFLIVSGVLIFNLSTILLRLANTKFSRYIPLMLLSIGIVLCLDRIGSRKYNYNYSGFTTSFKELEMKSKEEQKALLGKHTYDFFSKLDNNIPFNF